MKRVLLVLGVLVSPVEVRVLAQAPEKEAQSEDANAKKLAELDQRVADARKSFEEKLKAAKDDEERAKIAAKENPEKGFAEEYRALAKVARGTEVGAKCWKRVMLGCMRTGDGGLAAAACRVMLLEYGESAQADLVVILAPQVLGDEEGEKALIQLRTKNTTKEVAAALVFVEVQKMEGEKGSDAPEVHGMYERLAKEFAELATPWGEGKYGDVAGAWLFVSDNLKVGKVAPGFEAVDENGVKWKLEEYRGKVVVIDFWGDW